MPNANIYGLSLMPGDIVPISSPNVLGFDSAVEELKKAPAEANKQNKSSYTSRDISPVKAPAKTIEDGDISVKTAETEESSDTRSSSSSDIAANTVSAPMKRSARFTSSDLRRGVIMSEILSQPISLRRKKQYR